MTLVAGDPQKFVETKAGTDTAIVNPRLAQLPAETDGQNVGPGVLIGFPLRAGRRRVLGDVVAYNLLDRPLSTCHAVLLQCQPLPFGNQPPVPGTVTGGPTRLQGASWP
jgi:hypothetical protein